jgi:HSP20 family protein
MRLMRWDPFRDTEDFLRRGWPRSMSRVMEGQNGGTAGLEWSPGADITESDREFTIRAELPGVKKEDVRVTIEGSTITLSGERKLETEEKDVKFHRIESFHGTFSRSFELPDNVDRNAIAADSKDGVLLVHLPKVRLEKPQPLEIKVR